MEGGYAPIVLGRKLGALHITVEHPTGSPVTIKYERMAPCRLEPGAAGDTVNCPVSWTETHHVATRNLEYDPLLRRLHITDQLKGKSLTLTLIASKPAARNVNENGYLTLETAEALAQGAWGSQRFQQPADVAVPSTIFRRVSAA